MDYNCIRWQVIFIETLLSKEKISSLKFESISQDLLPKTILVKYLDSKNIQLTKLKEINEKLLKVISKK